jgi:pyruvate dehydrogenase E1 component
MSNLIKTVPDSFGQFGNIPDLYKIHDLSSGSIVIGALAALSLNS